MKEESIFNNQLKDKKIIKELSKAISYSFSIVFNKKIKPDFFYLIYDFVNTSFNETAYLYGKKLFECARIDLEASKLLYKEELYPASIYHLQQCIEKLTKSFGIITGTIKKEELHKKAQKEKKNLFMTFLSRFKKQKEDSIGHISPKTFVLMLNKKKVYLLYKEIASINGISNIDKDLKKFRKLVEKSPKKLAKISESEIENLIKTFERIFKRIKKVNKRDLRFKLKHFFISLEEQIKRESYFHTFKNEINILKNKIKIFVDYIDLYFGFIFLYLLSVITYPHYNWARYPKENNKSLGFLDYNQNLGIVKTHSMLTRFTENYILKNFENRLKLK